MHQDYGYRVVSLGSGQLMPEKWKIDNYYERNGRLVEKRSADYVIDYDLDEEGDGEFETNVNELRYDLKFEHLVHGGSVILSSALIGLGCGNALTSPPDQ